MSVTLMRNSKVIAKVKSERNLFTLDLAAPNQAMSARVIVIREKGCPKHLVSENKRIRLWHQYLAHVSNARVVKTFKLVDGIDISLKKYEAAKISIKEYDSSEVAMISDNSEVSSNENESLADIASRPRTAAIPDTNFFSQTRGDNNGIFKLCTLCIGSKSTRIVRWDKSMTPTIDKLEEVHADL